MSEINLPQGYSIRRTSQGIGNFFDVYMLIIGFVLIGTLILFITGFLLLSDLFLGLVCSVFLWLLIEHFKNWIQIKQAGLNYRCNDWIISFNGDDVGIATIQKMKNYANLRKLEVQPTHQRKGLGTALVKYMVSEVDQPIYVLLCKPYLEAFFRHLEFVVVERNGMGLGMRYSVSGSCLGIDELEKVQLPEGFKVEILKGIYKLKSQFLFLKQYWNDCFYFRIFSLTYLLFGLCIFSIVPNFKDEGMSDIDLIFIFIQVQALLLFFVLIIFHVCNFIPNYYLKLYFNRKTLTSVFIRWVFDSVELYVFDKKCIFEEQSIKADLIQHVTKVVDVPVYLVCDRQHSNFYAQMGFQPVAKHKIPFILKVTSRTSDVGMCYSRQSDQI